MERYSNERIEINGKTMSRYEWTQKMREIETVVRKHKDRANLYKQAGDDRARRREQSSINRLRLAYSKVADAAGLPEETDRMTVSGFRPVKESLVNRERSTKKESRYSVNMDFVKSPDYKQKFSGLTNDPVVDELLHTKAIEILTHRNGSYCEDLFLIDVSQKKVIGSNTFSREEKRVGYTNKMKKAIIHSKESTLITMHNHPGSASPSGDDLYNSKYQSVKFGVVVCHNGEVFIYKAHSNNINFDAFEDLVKVYMRNYSDHEAFKKAVEEVNSGYNLIEWRAL